MHATVLRSLAVSAALCCALAATAPARASAPSDFRRLPVAASRFGRLDVTLVAARTQVVVDGVRLDALTFNGEYAGPVLRLRPGDRLNLHLVNRLDEPLNLHFHGSHASPLGRGDNVHISVPAGGVFDYRVDIPRSQPPGLYWYHTHIHGRAEAMVNRGLAGAMIIEGVERRVPETAKVRSRLLVLKSFDVDRPDDPEVRRLHGVVQSINGAAHAEIGLRPGETEFWRLGNFSPNTYFHLSLPGFTFRVVALDGAPTNRDLAVERLDIAPGSRMEVLVAAPSAPGRYPLLSGATATGLGKALKLSRELALVEVAGEPVAALASASRARPPITPDLRQASVSARRELVYSQTPGEDLYLINGKTFDHGRVDFRTPLGSIEEWTIRNDTDDMHTFHIHQVHFQVVAIDGAPQPFEGVLDNVRVPERGSITVRIPFTDPQIVGTLMFHCHVLMHEDRGMMGMIEVYDPAAPARSALPGAQQGAMPADMRMDMKMDAPRAPGG